MQASKQASKQEVAVLSIPVVGVVAQKGGVGKTTTADNVAHRFALGGLRVLLVDVDTQGHAGRFLGAERGRGLTDAMMRYDAEGKYDRTFMPMEKCITHAVRERLDILCNDPSMAAAELLVRHDVGHERILRYRLEEVQDQYDMVLIDIGPTVTVSSNMALAACSGILVPVAPGTNPEDTTGELLARLRAIERGLGHRPRLLGFFPTLFDGREKIARDLRTWLEQQEAVGPTIRKNVALAEANIAGQSIWEYAPTSPGAQDYRILTEWLYGQLNEATA
jgi:chromosome partitioning protein